MYGLQHLRNVFQVSAVMIGLSITSLAAAEGIYKWVDNDGSVHYSDHPPTETSKSEKLSVGQEPTDDIVVVARETRERIQQEQRIKRDQRAAAREQERLQAEMEQAERDRRQQRCAKAHEEIQNLNHHMPVYYVDQTGNRVFLDDERRAELIDYYKREQNMYCE